jgi:hypothetical protein
VTIYTRRHVNIDNRFFYGDCVGSRLEEKLALHKQAREWSKADTKAYLDERYRGQILEEMMRAGLANQSKEEKALNHKKIQEAIDLLTPKEQHEVTRDYPLNLAQSPSSVGAAWLRYRANRGRPPSRGFGGMCLAGNPGGISA